VLLELSPQYIHEETIEIEAIFQVWIITVDFNFHFELQFLTVEKIADKKMITLTSLAKRGTLKTRFFLMNNSTIS